MAMTMAMSRYSVAEAKNNFSRVLAIGVEVVAP